MPCSAAGCEEDEMAEPIFGLIVSLFLGGYLLYTLVRPEKI